MEGRQKKTINWKIMTYNVDLQESSTCLWINHGKTMTIIKYIVLIRACWSIEPCIFVVYFLIMFPTAISSFKPTKERHIFLHNMEIIRIIIMKEIWRIRRVVKVLTYFYKKQRCQLGADLGYGGIFIQVGSIINGNGKHRW